MKTTTRITPKNIADRKAVCACKDGEILHFVSVSEAERYFNSRHISDVLKGKRADVKGWKFAYGRG